MTKSVYDHVWLTDAGHPEGIYRVVGVDGETVTLLRVSDEGGRRRSTGEVVAVSAADLERCDPAENPDGNRPLGAAVASRLEAATWKGRVFVRQSTAHPIPAGAAATLVAAGLLGDRLWPLPEAVAAAAIVVGSLALAYVGSGRLS